jgi:hypothetical protein
MKVRCTMAAVPGRKLCRVHLGTKPERPRTMGGGRSMTGRRSLSGERGRWAGADVKTCNDAPQEAHTPSC